jgi:hypothetical protein
MGELPHTHEDAEAKSEVEQQVKKWETVEDTVKTDGSTTPDTLREPDIVHVVGDTI